MVLVQTRVLRLALGLGVVAGLAAAPEPAAMPDFLTSTWKIDPRPVLARGGEGAVDRGVVGDPCIVWDDTVGTWRMFYFASGFHPATRARGPRTAMALAASGERIGPGDWQKIGLVRFNNPEALINPNDYHKWWVVMEAKQPNRAARIGGDYWAVFVASKRTDDGRVRKHLQAASARTLAGPWTVRAEPIIAPGEGDALDALHADTPSAFWFAERKRVVIFYKGYPERPQAEQPGAPFGSGTLIATWHPDKPNARDRRVLMRPGQNHGWNQGWMSSVQLLFHAGAGRWYGLHNASPTPPTDQSHREPAPSLGGWVVCDGDPLTGRWRADAEHSPFRRPEQLTADERAAGLAVNFWRHHLLVTPEGRARIFFNSGAYGAEQMYSLTCDEAAP